MYHFSLLLISLSLDLVVHYYNHSHKNILSAILFQNPNTDFSCLDNKKQITAGQNCLRMTGFTLKFRISDSNGNSSLLIFHEFAFLFSKTPMSHFFFFSNLEISKAPLSFHQQIYKVSLDLYPVTVNFQLSSPSKFCIPFPLSF